jgi:TP901 family phage tail tape measure protein
MALDAGSVFTILGGKFAGAGFQEFDAANKKAVESATQAEAAIAGAQGRAGKAHEAAASSARKAAEANDAVASSGRRLRESLPLAAMENWSKSSDQAGKNLSKLGSVATKRAAVGILGLGAAAVYAATKAVTFNREMLKISTQAGGSASEVKKLSAEVLAMAGTVPQGPQKLAEGLYHIQSAGFRGAQAMEMLKAAAQGAALGNADLQATTQAMIATMASQIKGVHGSADAMGQLNDIVGVGDMRMEQLAQAMATGLLPSAHDAGLSLKDVGAALATVTDNATPANVTATRLRMTIALMAAPSKAAVKQLESIGLTSTSLAHDMRQPNGLLLAIQDLKTHLHDSGKTAEEQDAVLSHVFGGGKSSAVIHTLISEIGRLETKYQQLGASNGPAKLAKSWAEYQKSQSASFGELKSGAEAFAITVGNVVMPELTKLAHGATHALDGFVKDGGAARAGQAISSVFSTLGTVVGNVAPVIAGIARALVDFGKAVGLGNPAELTGLIAGFLAFRGLTFVAPILTAIAAGIAEIGVAAATAGSLSAFGGDLVALAGGPVGAIVIALSLAAGAFVALKSGLLDSASAADRNAAALRADKAAIEGLNQATSDAARSELEAKQATLDNKAAKAQLASDEKLHREGKISDLQLEQDRLQVQRTGLRVQESAAEQIKKVNAERAKAESATTTNSKRGSELQDEITQVQGVVKRLKEQGASRAALRAPTEKLLQLEREYNANGRQQIALMAQISVAELSRKRLAHGQEAITPANAHGVNQLQIALSGLPQAVKTRFELSGDQNALAKLGELASKMEQLGHGQVMVKILTTAPTAAVALLAFRAVLHGVPGSKVVAIIHNAPSAKAAMSALHGAINAVPPSKRVTIATNAAQATGAIDGVLSALNALHDKQVNVTTLIHTVTTGGGTVSHRVPGSASGRSAGVRELGLVGEGLGPEYVVDSRTGKGGIVTGPTLMGLGPSDYVVPLEDRYRGRALGLFAQLARDLGVPGYKKGKGKGKGKAHHPMPIPDAIPPLSLPLSDIESKESTAKGKYEHAASKVHSLEGKLRTAERTLRYASPKSKPKAKARVDEIQKELAKAKESHDYTVEHRTWQEWQRTLREAKAFQTKINVATSEANNAGNAMKLAAEHHDETGYNTAKGKRLGALGRLKALIQQAQKQVKTGSEYALQLEGQVQNAELEAGSTEGEAFSPVADKAAEAEEASGMTPAEEERLKKIEARVSLAALTTGLDDDKAAAGELVSFLETVLGEVQAEPGVRGGDSSIKNIADSLRTARSNLDSLSGGSATNENADLQAQITQANERTALEKRRADINEGALQVLGGPGDIGSGGLNARGATININTLHPGDPATLRAIGDAATAGMGLQGSRRAVRVAVGP